MTTNQPHNALEAARLLLSFGMMPVPIPPEIGEDGRQKRSKNPQVVGWNRQRYSLDDQRKLEINFGKHPLTNVGIMHSQGTSVHTVDFEADTPAGVAVIRTFLPDTNWTWGRKSRPASHRLYLVDHEVKASDGYDIPDPRKSDEDATDKKRAKLIERLGKGKQSVVPGSIHETGEAVEFTYGIPTTPPTRLTPDQVALWPVMQATTILAHNFPAKGSGIGHDLFLALGGWLASGGVEEPVAIKMFEAIFDAIGETDADARLRDLAGTYTRHRNGELVLGVGWFIENDFWGDRTGPLIKKINELLKIKRTSLETKQKHLDEVQDLNLTELGNAMRFLKRVDGTMLWATEFQCWLVWNGSWWEIDETNQAKRMMIETVLQMNRDALAFTDPQKRALQQEWALKSETDRVINAALNLAKSYVSVVMASFDTNRDLVALRGATVDLRTGVAREPDPNDNITKGLDFAYDPKATCPKFLDFITTMFVDDQELIEFVQRLVGYSATGYSNEKIMIFCHGPKDAGKTLLVELLAEMFGVYAAKLPSSLFTTGLRGSGEYDLINLRGARYAFSTEVEEGEKLAQARVKEITGGDSIRGRNPYGRPVYFSPTHTIWLATNHKPKVRGGDEATWRRLMVVPASHTVPEEQQNTRLLDELIEELPGIFNWAVVGAQRWYVKGLKNPPEKVTLAKKAYREENELVTKFLSDSIVKREGEFISVSQFYSSFAAWCVDYAGENPSDIIGAKALSREMQERGYVIKQIAAINRRGYVGIAFRSQLELVEGGIEYVESA